MPPFLFIIQSRSSARAPFLFNSPDFLRAARHSFNFLRPLKAHLLKLEFLSVGDFWIEWKSSYFFLHSETFPSKTFRT